MEKTWKPEPQLLESLDAGVPEILDSQKANGQFGTEPWISTDQNRLLPLAAAWRLKGSAHHRSDEPGVQPEAQNAKRHSQHQRFELRE